MNSAYYRRLRLTVFLCLFIGFNFISANKSIANEVFGYVGVEGRYFIEEPLLSEQEEHGASVSAYLEYYRDFDDSSQRIAFTGFARLDSADDERSHADIRELYWWKDFNQFELYAGIRKVFWGVTESVHLVDVINQADALENLDGEDKLGQPMIQLVKVSDIGTFQAFVLPYFRERESIGPSGRLRPGVQILDEASYQSSDEESHIDLAFRWSHYFDIWDVGFSHFSGTQRNPIYQPIFSDEGLIGLRPYYAQVEQSGLDIQATMGAWLLKLELASIDEQDESRNTALAGGFEYTFFTVAGTNGDLGIVLEYQFDDRIGLRQSVSQNDIAGGIRWAFNDLDGSSILALVSQDLDYGNQFFSLELSRRLNDDWKLEAEARIFNQIDERSPEYALREDSYIQLEMRRYF